MRYSYPHPIFSLSPISPLSSRYLLWLMAGFLLVSSVAGAGVANDTEAGLLSLTAVAPVDAAAQWHVLANDARSMRLELELSGLRHRAQDIAGETWHTLSIDGGGLLGAAGAPGLPIIGRLVAVPPGVAVAVRVVEFDSQKLSALRLLPVPTDDASFQIDHGTYRAEGWQAAQPVFADQALRAGDTAPTVFVGAPANLAGQDVIPLTAGPVVYDPVAREAWVANRIEIELTFVPDPNKAGPPDAGRTQIGAAFSRLLAERALGYDAAAQSAATAHGPGTWAVVCRAPGVVPYLQPLLDWRARQGYHVEVISEDLTAVGIKSALQEIYDDPNLPPLEFILLAGDTDSADLAVPTWFETVSGYNGEGDHYYATLAGDDILADAHIGRLSVTSLAQLTAVIDKIVAYEQHPPMDDTTWFQEACVAGDPLDSGITTIYVNQWLKGQLLANGYAAVDTIWDGNFLSQFMASINAGKSAFGYRGFWGMSGIQSGHIEALSNGGRLPVAILPTCETGTFAEPTTCNSEAFLRAANGGAIAAIGTATGGTHTRYNNCYYQGVWDGLLNAPDPRIGVAHTLGKLELYSNYFAAEPIVVESWSVWNNIMGDPASAIWQSVPRVLEVTHDAQLAVGSGAVVCAVTSGSQPVADALVCLHRAGEVQVTGRTDASGQVLLATPPLTAGSLQITVTGRGLLPYLGEAQVGAVDAAFNLGGMVVDDDAFGLSNGNGDGVVNPGETLELALAATNLGTGPALAVSGHLGEAPWSVVDVAEVSFGDVAPGGTVWGAGPVVVAIDPAAPDGARLTWPVQIESGAGSWPAVATAEVRAAALAVTGTSWDGGASFAPGQTGQLTVALTNEGHISANAVSAVLTSESSWVQVADDAGSYGPLGIGASGENTSDPFQLEIAADCYPGHLAVLQLEVAYNGGMRTTTDVAITVGTAASDDPTGPGSGGYYAFDDTDTENYFAPVYDWVALDPDHGGPGVAVGLTDFGWEEDDTKTIDLPFTFRYYGRDFDRVSICSNGWLAMGETPLVHYRNYAIPAKGSPGSMIAPFWDNLQQIGSRQVYSHYDEENHRFVVQWYKLTNDFSGAVENFEVLLLDPLWHPTATGDGVIIFQYEAVANTDSRDGFATVGLQNHDRTGGLLYSYWNQYAAGAAPLAPGRAIRFQPLGEIRRPEASVAPLVITQTLSPDAFAEHTLHITNSGQSGSLLSYRIVTRDPATLAKGIDAEAASDQPADKDIQGSTMSFATDQYVPGTTVDVEMSVMAVVPGFGFLSEAQLTLPVGVTLNTTENLTRLDGGYLEWQEQVGDGVTTNWTGLYDGFLHYIPDGETASATLNLTFAADLTGDLSFAYRLEDLGYVGPPDLVEGVIELTNDLPSVRIHTPNAGTIAVIDQETTVSFTMLNASGQVDIALQRDAAGPWDTLATQVDASAGNWTWPVAGEPGPYARLRISDSHDAAVLDVSDVFVVSRDLSWVQLASLDGVVAAGETATVGLTLAATGLQPGQYAAVLLLETNTEDTVSVPIDLTVSGASAAGDELPRRVTLRGGHPNPFNPMTTVAFELPRQMAVTLDVFDARGLRVRRILDGVQAAGPHRVSWDGTAGDGRPVASGVYFLRLATPERTLTDKLLLAK